MKVVLDTNVIVSRFLSPQGIPARLVAFWEQHTFELLVSVEIIADYQIALNYDHVRRKHGFTVDEISHWVSNIWKYGQLIETEGVSAALSKDPDDNKFLECAIAGGADYIISGDAHLLSIRQYEGIPILPPAAFLLILNQQV